jgi:hypothetical protein
LSIGGRIETEGQIDDNIIHIGEVLFEKIDRGVHRRLVTRSVA